MDTDTFTKSRSALPLAGGLAALLPVFGSANEPTHRDLEYARVGEPETALLLDLYLPEEVTNPPLIVWVHGGAWRTGSKERMPIGGMIEHGFAIASLNYRLSPVAPFPAQVHDIKAAIRWLRAHNETYGYRDDEIALAGASAGGHLAALVGLTNGHAELEGGVGDFTDESSRVSAIVDFYGPTNFLTILSQSTPHGLGVRIPALQLLLRAQPEDAPDLAQLASPVFHVDKNDPPILIFHGDQDPQVPINQSHELVGSFKAAGLENRVLFEVIHGGAHGGDPFYKEARLEIISRFLNDSLP